MSIVPKEIRENIARAKGYLRRNEVMRAMEAMGSNMRLYANDPSLKQHTNDITKSISTFLEELTFHPRMKCLLDPKGTGSPSQLIYTKNKEMALAVVLEGLAKLLQKVIDAESDSSKSDSEKRMHALIAKGEEYFKNDDIQRGRAFFSRAASEFGKADGVYIELGRRLFLLEQYSNAASMYELCIEEFPKDSTGYVEGVEAYIKAKKYSEAEKMYIQILRQFGGHAKTYGRMAKLYLLLNNKAKAFDFANRALKEDPEQEDALEVSKKLGY